jgi:hypothetical protein
MKLICLEIDIQKMLRYSPPKPSPLPADFDEFYASLTPMEQELHKLAIEKLQSSYFVQWSHMYRNWKKARDGSVSSKK